MFPITIKEFNEKGTPEFIQGCSNKGLTQVSNAG